MFSKILTSTTLVLALSLQVHAHAAIAPALGVSGTPVRNDVQRPSTKSPCGTVDIASTLDTSTPVQAAADGTFKVTVTDFNAGADGSRSVSAEVDPTGVGSSFKAVTVSTNGNANPTTVGSDTVVASLPSGTTCSGGKAGNLCLVSFKTTAGFGNCVVVSQGAGGATAASTAAADTAPTSSATATATASTAATTTATTTKKTKGNEHCNGKKAAAKAKANRRAYGARAPLAARLAAGSQ